MAAVDCCINRSSILNNSDWLGDVIDKSIGELLAIGDK